MTIKKLTTWPRASLFGQAAIIFLEIKHNIVSQLHCICHRQVGAPDSYSGSWLLGLRPTLSGDSFRHILHSLQANARKILQITHWQLFFTMFLIHYLAQNCHSTLILTWQIVVKNKAKNRILRFITTFKLNKCPTRCDCIQFQLNNESGW
jgi:hypothetical protein